MPPEAPISCLQAGARLKLARESQGLARIALARAAGLTDTTVRLTEEGQTIPSVATAEQLAAALEVSPCWLAYGEGAGPGEEQPPPVKRPRKAPAPRKVAKKKPAPRRSPARRA